MTPVELAQKYKLVTVGQDHLALNDDLVHEVLIVGDNGAMQPGVQIKDLDSNTEGIVVEYAFIDTLIQNLVAAKQKLNPVLREMVQEKMASVPGSALALAKKYVELHNAAALEYKNAFAAVGAKLWHDDDAHLIPLKNLQAIADTIESVEDPADIYSIAVPLTVLDSYPNISVQDRVKLRREVAAIHRKYQALLDKAWRDDEGR